MRTTMLSSMLETLAYNHSHKNADTKIFEVGKVYLPTGEVLPDEQEKIAIGISGAVDFYDLKGIVEALLDALRVSDAEYVPECENPSFHPGRCATLEIGGKNAGVFGEIHPDVLAAYGIGATCYVAELDLKTIFDAMNTHVKYKKLPRFPAAERDIALLADKGVAVAELEKTIRKAGGEILDTVTLFDVYEGAQIPKGKKRIAYAVTFRAADRSLTNDEVNKVFNKIIKDLEYKNGAVLR